MLAPTKIANSNKSVVTHLFLLLNSKDFCLIKAGKQSKTNSNTSIWYKPILNEGKFAMGKAKDGYFERGAPTIKAINSIKRLFAIMLLFIVCIIT